MTILLPPGASGNNEEIFETEIKALIARLRSKNVPVDQIVIGLASLGIRLCLDNIGSARTIELMDYLRRQVNQRRQ